MTLGSTVLAYEETDVYGIIMSLCLFKFPLDCYGSRLPNGFPKRATAASLNTDSEVSYVNQQSKICISCVALFNKIQGLFQERGLNLVLLQGTLQCFRRHEYTATYCFYFTDGCVAGISGSNPERALCR
jgi:hypothetical protein